MTDPLEKLLEVEKTIVNKYAPQIKGVTRASPFLEGIIGEEERVKPATVRTETKKRKLFWREVTKYDSGFVKFVRGVISSPVIYAVVGVGVLTYFLSTLDYNLGSQRDNNSDFRTIRQVQETLEKGRQVAAQSQGNYFDAFEPYLRKAEETNSSRRALVYNVIADYLIFDLADSCGDIEVDDGCGNDTCYDHAMYVDEKAEKYYKMSNNIDQNWYARYALLIMDIFDNGLDHHDVENCYCVAGEETQRCVATYSFSWKSEEKRKEAYEKAKKLLAEVRKEKKGERWERALTELSYACLSQSPLRCIHREFMIPPTEQDKYRDEICFSGERILPEHAIETLYPQTKIAFGSMKDENYDIYVVNADGSNQTKLTNNPFDNLFPSWSPSGKKIAFISDRDGNQEIYVMNDDGSNQINLTKSPADERVFSWSPDGEKIAFVSTWDENSDDIYVVNADGTHLTNLTKSPSFNDFNFGWSPDGRKIAFASDRDGNYDIYVMNADGSNQTNLSNNPFDDVFLYWNMGCSDEIEFRFLDEGGNIMDCMADINGSDTRCFPLYVRKDAGALTLPPNNICQVLGE